ncbi:unnamed protein product [Staurois parvus]|uniref:Secreted protein n=1 Tax=Staurois parvus TaxID=386267 RepID=A0ABN9C4E2_9NEOB|nr:unnamed protein product [Staurois parvus]
MSARALMISVAPVVPPVSVHQCRCQCSSVPRASAHQCHISVPTSAHLSVLSVSPISASKFRLSVPVSAA